MPARLRKKASGGWGGRIRFGEGLLRDEWFHIDLSHDQEPQAIDRLGRLQVMAKRLSEIGKHAEARLILEEAGATRGERGFHALEQFVAEMAPELAPQKKPRTFRQVAQDLCDGTLHDLYPDEVGARTKEGNDARRTQLSAFFPVLGDKTFEQITRADIDEAKRLIPKGVKQNTRVTYCRELRYLLKLAVEPLRLCEHVAHVSVPRQAPTDLFQLFYPDEEEQVAGSAEVSFEERFLLAFLPRNGGRITETLQYTWEAIDLERGKIRVAAAWTKTKRARAWDLEPDVLEALRLRRLQIPDATLVFVPPPGLVFTRFTVYQRLHDNLRAAGLTRPELFDAPEGERPLTLHDFRGSFVTFARAVGMPDVWIRDRSGHESPKMLERYDRGVRHARDRGLGWWAPMASALGMAGAKVRTRLGERLGPISVQSWSKEGKSSMITQLGTNRVNQPGDLSDPINPENSADSDRSSAPAEPLGPAGFSTSVQVDREQLHQPPLLDADKLTRLLALAERAKQWDLVAALGQALDAVSRAEPPNVTSLADARARRERGDL